MRNCGQDIKILKNLCEILVYMITIKFAQAVCLMTCLPIVTSRSSSISSSTCYLATGVKLQLIQEVREKNMSLIPVILIGMVPKNLSSPEETKMKPDRIKTISLFHP